MFPTLPVAVSPMVVVLLLPLLLVRSPWAVCSADSLMIDRCRRVRSQLRNSVHGDERMLHAPEHQGRDGASDRARHDPHFPISSQHLACIQEQGELEPSWTMLAVF